MLLAAPLSQDAQETPAVAGPPLAPFAAQRVAIVPVQLWRADTVGWSHGADWAQLRAALDIALGEALKERGMGTRWAYAADVVRSARRNPLYAVDPYALGVGRWRSTPPKAGEGVPEIIADNLRPITALGDTRYALIPVELRGEGDLAILRIILVDARSRVIVWGGDFGVPGGAGAVAALASRIADLIVEP